MEPFVTLTSPSSIWKAVYRSVRWSLSPVSERSSEQTSSLVRISACLAAHHRLQRSYLTQRTWKLGLLCQPMGSDLSKTPNCFTFCDTTTIKEDQLLEGSSQSGNLARALAAVGNGTVVFYVHFGIDCPTKDVISCCFMEAQCLPLENFSLYTYEKMYCGMLNRIVIALCVPKKGLINWFIWKNNKNPAKQTKY